eukprot:scpid47165/ scgid26585/ GDH/6PGL endoplasmic bifunctional protein; Glucose 1-dehydrogenase; Hexose-6-phosphate dehydrogenase; 6-phosphogluconolactonase
MSILNDHVFLVLLRASVVIGITCTCSAGGLATAAAQSDPPTNCVQTSVVLVGANGDLAKRYLWQAVYDLHLHHRHTSRDTNSELVAVCATRKGLSADAARNLVLSSVSCAASNASADCQEERERFVSRVVPTQLNKDADYEALDALLRKHAAMNGCAEQRLFYLAIPAFAFAAAASNIGTYCRPDNTSANSWLRVVFEKPFGHDFESANTLATSLREHLHDSEILLIDHYLGKTGVKAIPLIRSLLSPRATRNLWSGAALAKVEISVSEALDAAGRTRYYDEYGVVCDMLQNHLTSLLVLSACELNDNMTSPNGSGGCTTDTMHDVLSAIQPVHPSHVLLGQYDDYQRHCCHDNAANCGGVSRTATFASVLLRLRLPEWRGVAFVLTSGKAMPERRAFLALHYKQSHDNHHGNACLATSPALVLNIQGGERGTHLKVTKAISLDVSLPPGWSWLDDDVVEGECPYRIAIVDEPGASAYSSLLRSAVHGPDVQFVDTTSLLTSWRAWSPVIDWMRYLPLRHYNRESAAAGFLRTVVDGGKLRFASHATVLENAPRTGMPSSNQQLLGGTVFTGEIDDLTERLVSRIAAAMLESVRTRGSFHLALPGGSSPRWLLLALSLSPVLDTAPWENVHVWQVDERCVHPMLDASQYNFRQLNAFLLRHRAVQPENIHAMPVWLAGGVCAETDNGTGAYSEWLRMHANYTLDMAILGVGADGHIASLFPHTTSSDLPGYVLLSRRHDDALAVTPSARMTLTYRTLRNARDMVLLIHGASKSGILSELQHADPNTSPLPAAQLARTRAGHVTWYIDRAAYGV